MPHEALQIVVMWISSFRNEATPDSDLYRGIAVYTVVGGFFMGLFNDALSTAPVIQHRMEGSVW